MKIIYQWWILLLCFLEGLFFVGLVKFMEGYGLLDSILLAVELVALVEKDFFSALLYEWKLEVDVDFYFSALIFNFFILLPLDVSFLFKDLSTDM